ncbi:MAG: ATP-binding protein, partial [Gemmatimonadaceae bacterium]
IEQHLRESQRLDAVGRLAGGMAHDFNNLLAVILAETDLALDAPDVAEPARATLASIRHAARNGATLTRQLLTFARRQRTELATFDANGLVADVERIIRRLIGERVELQVAVASDLGSVHADRQQLEQVITNLAANARDAMPDGGTLSLRTLNCEFVAGHAPAGMRPGRWVVIEASDTGTGMSDEVRSRLFEPFFTTKERDKGTGLGLATSYGIINEFGGFIAVDSELGRGSTFSVFLPRAEGAATGVTSVPVRAAPVGTETVLIVEDQEQLRSVARRVLAKRGYTVHSATTGGEALESILRLSPPPDLALVDVNLPDGDGMEFARRLRTVRPTLHILLTSGSAGSVAPHDDEFAFLPKPFGAAELAQAVRDVLDRGHT